MTILTSIFVGNPLVYGSDTYYNTFCYMCNMPSDAPTRFQCNNNVNNYTSTFHEDVGPVYDLVFEPEPITAIEFPQHANSIQCPMQTVYDNYWVRSS